MGQILRFHHQLMGKYMATLKKLTAAFALATALIAPVASSAASQDAHALIQARACTQDGFTATADFELEFTFENSQKLITFPSPSSTHVPMDTVLSSLGKMWLEVSGEVTSEDINKLANGVITARLQQSLDRHYPEFWKTVRKETEIPFKVKVEGATQPTVGCALQQP
jgi:hypothetical protein